MKALAQGRGDDAASLETRRAAQSRWPLAVKWLGTASVFLVTVVAGGQSQPIRVFEVTAVRHWSLTGVTRVTVEITGQVRYHSARIGNPDRVFFDFMESRPHIGDRTSYSAEVGDQLVKRIRVAENVPGVTRLVLDLASAVEFTVSRVDHPSAFIIEFHAARKTPAFRTLQAQECRAEPALTKHEAATRQPQPMPTPPTPVVKAEPPAIPDPPMLGPELHSEQTDGLTVMKNPVLSVAMLFPLSVFPQEPITRSSQTPPPFEVRLPDGRLQEDEIRRADYEESIKDATQLSQLAQSLKQELEKNETHVLSLSSLKKAEEIERLAKRIHSRLTRF